MQEAANSSSTPGEARASVTSDVGNYSSVGGTQLSGFQVITHTPTSASTSQSLPSSLTTSCDDLWLTPLTLGERRLDQTQPGATQRTSALPSEALLARPLLPNPRLSVPPLGYARFISATTIPSRGEHAQYLPHPTQSPPSRTERHPQPPPRAPHHPQYPSPPLSHPPSTTYACVTSTPTDVSHRNWYTPPQPSVSHLGSPHSSAG
ncbi:hypothetical protein Pmani_014213 [Petrolisthes manimaculis]|uniref:Uncharacterized protein n=1 Tax=Petrolisthes manimaculis TaxID=1843537 RepID=A0AAE1U8L1_9EUCA|nr:hypothetical protein Pmani_014213 [Petrolisthes manimaculis]